MTGLVVVAVGLVLLADTTGTYDVDAWALVPAILVAVGVAQLVRHRFRSLFGPLVLVLVGALWGAVSLGYLTEEAAWSYWPLVVVVFGLSVLLGRRSSARRAAVREAADELERELAAEGLLSEYGDGEATALFGTVTVDLREGVDPPTDLDAVAVFGTVEVRVPPDWSVDLDAVGVFGSATDERRGVGRDGDGPDLRVSGAAIFGSIEVTD